MNTERWEQIKDLFESALSLEPEAREAFLRRMSGDDAALLAEVASLLASYEPDPSPADASGAEPASDTAIAGERIGPYQIIHRIGTGGMGAVYLAARADDVYSKRVAIKLVQAGVDMHEVLRHFRHERQILATLDHPNIAKLLDGGATDRGVPYFVMDYIEGTRIDEYALHGNLTVRERVRLFQDVCSAVQYVHQNLVVHRDLKPGNILVTPDGVPKLLDFGIAKLLKPELFVQPIDATRVEFRLLTPGYASPEQARGEPVTTVSDVYALGVILYELLTGAKPYRLQTGSPIEVLRAVCDQEPDKPSAAAPALRRQLAGDLDAIVLKALRKEPQRRYGSVELVADDLRRYLEGLPVQAHADSWSYRTGKFVRRHRASVAAAALIVMSLGAGVLATSWQARVAQAAQARAARQFDDVRRLTTSFLFEFHAAIRDLPGATPARHLLVQRAREYLSKLAAEAQGDRRLLQELAESYLKVGDVQGNPYAANLGDIDGATESYTHALAISKALVEADPGDATAARYLARSYKSLGEVLPQLGRPTDAIADFRQAAGIFQSLLAAAPADSGLREELAGTFHALGDLQGHAGLQNLGDPAGALDSYRKALALYEAATDPRSKTARRGQALMQIRIGDMQEMRDDLTAGLQAYSQALTISEALAAEDPTNAENQRRLALAYRKVGGNREDAGDDQAALSHYAKAEAINASLMAADPANVQASMSYAISLRWSGDLLKRTNDASGALAKYVQVLQILERLVAIQPKDVTALGRHSDMLIVTARLLAERGDTTEARRMTARGLAIARDLASRPDATPDDVSQYALAFLTCQPADLQEPATALQYAKTSIAKSSSGDSTNLDILAQAYFRTGDRERAIETEEQALRLLAPLEAHQPVQPIRRQLEARLAEFKASRARK